MTPSTICFLVLFLTTLSTSYSFIATTKMSFVVTTVLKTPLNLEEIFKARCKEYITIVNPEAFIENPKNCDRLWQLFKQAFAYKPECSVKPEDFKDFIEEADHLGKIKNKVMLWSGNVYPFVLDYAQSRKYITIRDQLSVFILRNVENWCGKTEEPGINYEGCQPYQQCQNNAVGAFWTQMSSFFVLKAEGTVSVMFNSSSEVAFNENKTFGRAELPNLHKDKVQKLEVFLVGNLREHKLETCEVGSMQKLRDIVEKKGINFKCWDSHPSVWHLQCLKSQEGCSFIRAKNSSILRSFGLSFLVIFSALCLHAVDFSAFLI